MPRRARTIHEPPRRGPGRPRKLTPEQAAKARANGALGGNTRDTLPDDVQARLGPPPSSALALRDWISRLLGELLWLSATGKISAGLAANLRTTAAALEKTLPLSIRRAVPSEPGVAEVAVVELEAAAEETDGPELELDHGGAGLRLG